MKRKLILLVIAVGMLTMSGFAYAQDIDAVRKAAEQGNAIAQFNLGAMCESGNGVLQDDKEAVNWYRKAAEQGFVLAQNNLGAMYSIGQGVPQNYVKAHLWLNLAASQGNESAIKNRDIIAKLMTPAQIAKAQELARNWEQTEP